MKIKLYHFLLVLMSSLLTLIACSKDSKDDNPPQPNVHPVEYVDSETLSLNEDALTLGIGDTFSLNVENEQLNLSPSGETYTPGIKWTSSDENVAVVNEYGVITAKSEGSVIITATSYSRNLSAICKVTVIPVEAKEITLDFLSKELYVDDSFKLSATISPTNTTTKLVVWTSSDESVAFVDEKGNVSAKSIGEAVITVATMNGNVKSSCTITVLPIPVKISLDCTTKTVYNGETFLLGYTITPDNAANKNVIWKSSDENVASVDNAGNVTAKSIGEAIITVETDDQTATAICKVTVKGSILLSSSKKEMLVGDDVEFKVYDRGNEVEASSVLWTTSDESIVAVDENGKVTAKVAGTATISAASKTNGDSYSCEITVTTIEKYIIIKFGTYSSYTPNNETMAALELYYAQQSLFTEADGIKYTRVPFSLINKSTHTINLVRVKIFKNGVLVANNTSNATLLPNTISRMDMTNYQTFTSPTTFSVSVTYSYNGVTYTWEGSIEL